MVHNTLTDLLQIIQTEIHNNPHKFYWEVKDIVVTGSRLFGYYRGTSDYDTIVYMDIIEEPRKHHIISHGTWYKGLSVSISLEDISLFNRKHREHTLPRLSLLTGKLSNWDDEQIKGYIEHRKKYEPAWNLRREWNTPLSELIL